MSIFGPVIFVSIVMAPNRAMCSTTAQSLCTKLSPLLQPGLNAAVPVPMTSKHPNLKYYSTESNMTGLN